MVLNRSAGACAIRTGADPADQVRRQVSERSVFRGLKLPRKQEECPQEYGVMKLETVPRGLVEQHLMPFLTIAASFPL